MGEPTNLGSVLIVGGTGMLKDVSIHSAAHANNLLIASRDPHKLANQLGATALEFNWDSGSSIPDALQQHVTFDMLVSWVHREALHLIEPLEAYLKVNARSIRIHGCESVDPNVRTEWDAGSRTDIVRQSVVLGWVNQPGGSRWLTHPEISRGVIHAVNNQQDIFSVVGSLEKSRPLF